MSAVFGACVITMKKKLWLSVYVAIKMKICSR